MCPSSPFGTDSIFLLMGRGLSSSSGVPGAEIMLMKGCDTDRAGGFIPECSGNERDDRYCLRLSGEGDEPLERDSMKLLRGDLSAAEPITCVMQSSICSLSSSNSTSLKYLVLSGSHADIKNSRPWLAHRGRSPRPLSHQPRTKRIHCLANSTMPHACLLLASPVIRRHTSLLY